MPAAAPKTRLGNSASAIRFLLLSAASVATTLGVTAAGHELFGVQEEVAYFSALVVALIQNFLGMRYYVYPGSSVPLMKQLQEFVAASLLFRGGEYFGFIVMHTLGDAEYISAIVLIMLISFIAKFLFYRVAIFR
jgi:putative flippase GtrA